MNTTDTPAATSANPQSPAAKPRPKARSKEFSPKALKKFSYKLFRDWQRLDAAAKTDFGLKELADQFYKVHVELHRTACRRETREAESKDFRAGNPVLWTLFAPDSLMGMKITTRTLHRRIEQRVPTWLDVAGLAFFGKREDLQKYQPQATAAFQSSPWAELDSEWHRWDREKRLAGVGAQVGKVMKAWSLRFAVARAQEARELRDQQEAA